MQLHRFTLLAAKILQNPIKPPSNEVFWLLTSKTACSYMNEAEKD